MIKAKVTVAILVLTLALFIPFAIQAKPTPTPPGQHLNITQVFVDVPPGQITINGTDLDFGPGPLVVTLGNFGPLDNCSGDDMEIVCDLPKVILKGDYLLTVSNGNGQSQGDEYDLTICSDLAACFDAHDYGDTEDPDPFIADCISSAGCPDALFACNRAGTSSKVCTACLQKGGDYCDDCNEQMIIDLECTNICEDETQCFYAGDYVGDVGEFLTACEEIAECGGIEECEGIVNASKACAACVIGEQEACNVCTKEMMRQCKNICGGGGPGPVPIPH